VVEGRVTLDIRRPPARVASALRKAATATGIEEYMLRAVAWTESRFNTEAVSEVGAMGLMQLMPETAESLGVTDPFDPTQNARAGAKMLRSLIKEFGDWYLALGAYNWGPGNVSKHPDPNDWPAETQAYVPKVLDAYTSLKTTVTVPLPPTTTPLVAELLHKLARPYPWARRST
jgi:soluble lytic murein transglycosylase-like protein